MLRMTKILAAALLALAAATIHHREAAASYAMSERARVVVASALPAYTAAGSGLTRTITANSNGALASQDGVSLAVGDQILLTAGAAGADNGLWSVTSLGGASATWSMTRTVGYQTNLVFTGMQVFVGGEGTQYGGTLWALTTSGAITVDTTATTWAKNPVNYSGAILATSNPQSTTPYTIVATDYYIPVTTGASNFTVTLTACNSAAIGRRILIKKVDSGNGAVIIGPNGTDTIDGTNANAQFGGVTSSAASDTKGQNDYVELLCRAAGAWDVVNQRIAYGAALTSGTPSTYTATVPTGSVCTCTDATTQANPCKASVSSTTLTVTGIATNTDVVNAICTF